MSYKILPQKRWKQQSFSFVPIREKDMESIRIWRNLQMDILRQNEEISVLQQRQYFNQVIKPTFSQLQPNQILFSIFKDSILIGYGGLVHFNWAAKTAEISFLLEPSLNNHIRSFTEIFDEFLLFLQKISFDILSLDKIYTYAYDIRTYLYPPLEKHGFVCEARLKNHTFVGGESCDIVIHAKYRNQPAVITRQKITILVTSLSKKVPLVNSLREMFEEHNIDARIIGGDASNDCLGKYFVDEFWFMPKLHELQIQEVIHYCHLHKISIILPTRDAELEFWSIHKSTLKKSGIFVMISSRKTIGLCYDKWKFYKYLQNSSLPVVETSMVLKKDLYESYVAKSRFGSGSHTSFIDVSYEVANSILKNEVGFIVQPFIEGQEYSIDCYRSSKSHEVSLVIRSRDVVINGESAVSTVQYEDEEIQSIVSKTANALNIEGHCVFQGIRSKETNSFILIECNPRVGGASSLSMKVGLTSLLWFAHEQKLIKIEQRKFEQRSDISQMIRVPKDFYI